ncbi:MAG: NUDIX domain-containing protein [Candidatus Aenigmarchaeota archaeon]|nr:NUDIX domain-containing protein [Candidatus Aenigmarchaeota archaeon]
MGKNIKFYIGVKALILNDKNKMLLLKAAPSETKFEKKKTDAQGRPLAIEFWDFPGGRIQAGESLEDTLKKEAREEIGAPDIQIGGIFHAVISNFMIKDSPTEQTPLTLIVYRCKIDTKKPIKLSSEHSEYKWFSPKEAKKVLLTKYPKSFVDKMDG